MITLQEIVFYAKVVGSIGSAIAVLYSGFKYLKSVYNQRKRIEDTVELLATNHLPHLQSSLDSHGEVLQALTSDMKSMGTRFDGMETRLEDTKAGVHTLGKAFIEHLEKVSAESRPKRKKR